MNKNTHRNTVLIVEDVELNREMLKGILEDEYDVIEAANGEEGLDAARNGFGVIDIVLTDLVMPVMDGFAFLEKMAADAKLSHLPIIVVTGNDDVSSEEKCATLGAVDFLSKPYNPLLVKTRIRNIIRMRRNAVESEQMKMDPATGLYSRPAFLLYSQEAVTRDDWDVVLADIENFKAYNDIHGTAIGDELIRSISAFMKGVDGTYLLARYSGDEFIFLMKHSDGARKVCQEIIDGLPKKGLPSYTVNFASCHITDDIALADAMEYAAFAVKTLVGKFGACFVEYEGDLIQQHRQNQLLETRFEKALEDDEFVAYYQPKYSAKTEKIVGAEALVRWKNPDGSMVSPGAFIPLFENDGLIKPLDEYMYEKVCRFIAKRTEENKLNVPISVNLSRASIGADDIVAKYDTMVTSCKVEKDLVPIELTESSSNVGRITETVNALHDSGFRIHLDDFGSGYSSLATLVYMPLEVIKLDKSIIDNIGDDKCDNLLIHMIGLAKYSDIKVVAEGVEQKEQADFLRKIGCDYIQGYYFSRPLPEEEFVALLDAQLK